MYKNWFESREKANEWISEIGTENPSPSDAIDMSEKEKTSSQRVWDAMEEAREEDEPELRGPRI